MAPTISVAGGPNSGTDNIQANLHYYRLKKKEEAKKRDASKKPKPLVSAEADSGPTVELTSFCDCKKAVTKTVKHLTGLSLADAVRLVENAPTTIGRCDSESQARAAVEEIHDAGGIAELG